MTAMKPPTQRQPASREASAKAEQATSGSFPAVRMRRNRRTAWARRLVAETVLTPADLIWPIFVVEGRGVQQEVPSMPGVSRLSVIHDLTGTPGHAAMVAGVLQGPGEGGGWTWILSDLKSLLETGSQMSTAPWSP